GNDYVPNKTRDYANKKGNTQDAHEAIRPTSALRDPLTMKPYLSRDQFRLYKLIWERFLSSQMASAIMDTMSVDIQAGDALFKASGSKIKFPGFMKLYVEGSDDEQTKDEESFLPPLEKGMNLKNNQIEPKQHFTQPPPRYTESRLVRTL